MFYGQSPFPWSPLQRCSWKTETIQVDHEAGQQLIVRQALGRRAAGSLLQLQGARYLYFGWMFYWLAKWTPISWIICLSAEFN